MVVVQTLTFRLHLGHIIWTKNDAPAIGRDAGYRMFDTGLKRYSDDFIKRIRATRGISALTARAISFSNIQ